jgi:hypothetical protein
VVTFSLSVSDQAARPKDTAKQCQTTCKLVMTKAGEPKTVHKAVFMVSRRCCCSRGCAYNCASEFMGDYIDSMLTFADGTSRLPSCLRRRIVRGPAFSRRSEPNPTRRRCPARLQSACVCCVTCPFLCSWCAYGPRSRCAFSHASLLSPKATLPYVPSSPVITVLTDVPSFARHSRLLGVCSDSPAGLLLCSHPRVRRAFSSDTIFRFGHRLQASGYQPMPAPPFAKGVPRLCLGKE